MPLNDASFIFATLSNFQKICPNIFHTWMNILNRMPGSKMLLVAYEGSSEAIQNLRSYAPLFGNQGDSLAYAPQQPWIYHLRSKTALDMILDTRLKNGHTTGLDGLWAGVPTVTLGGMKEMGKRAGESFAAGLDLYTGLAFSLKEYEDIAIEFARSPSKLKTWRDSLGRKRVTESLFDSRYHTRNLELVLEAVWEIKHISARNGKTYNVVSLPPRGPPHLIETHQVDDDDPDLSHRRPRQVPGAGTPNKSGHFSDSEEKVQCSRGRDSGRDKEGNEGAHYTPLPPDLFTRRPLMLNLGGYQQQRGWVNVNIQSSSFGHSHVAEVVRSIGDLHGIPDGSVDALYCSHALEHMKLSQLEGTLDEWARVLTPGGLLFVSVPDLEVMARLVIFSLY